jgi:hypothetical protein
MLHTCPYSGTNVTPPLNPPKSDFTRKPKRKENAMTESGKAGKMSFGKIATAEKLGIRTGSITHMVEMFLEWGNAPGAEAYAAYWIQMRNGVLLLEMTPGNSASGAIYLLDLSNQVFYEVTFEELGATITRSQFCLLLKEYRLIQYASNPRLIHAPIPEPASA